MGSSPVDSALGAPRGQSFETADGTEVLVSHDRRIVSRLATQLSIVGEGTDRVYNGTIEEWMASLRP